MDVHPGKDVEIRVVILRTPKGVQLKRLTVKLCILPTEVDSLAVENYNFQRGGECIDCIMCCRRAP